MDDVQTAVSAGRLIVIDDEPAVGAFLGRVARRAGFDVIVTADAGDFKQRVRSWHPALIMLDLGMPDTDGVEMLRFLADERISARILIISGFDEKILDAAERLGAARGLNMAGVLRKPVRVEELMQVLRRVANDVSAMTAARMAEGLDRGEFFLEYQPKIELGKMQPYGVEALLRWRHPEVGLVPPMTFIPIAEQSDLIDRVTEWVLHEALRQREAWSRMQVSLSVAVNLSAKNFDGGDITGRLLRSPSLGFEPDKLVIELTETAAMSKNNRATDLLTRLRLRGVGLSIDDFGTGYSSLSQLQRLPFSEVKIDKSFVIDCATSKDNATIVYAVIDLAHRLGLKVVAEGVETAAAMHLLGQAGCDAAQGYLISKPIAANDIPGWFQAHAKLAA